jgi:hypothetical protein
MSRIRVSIPPVQKSPATSGVSAVPRLCQDSTLPYDRAYLCAKSRFADLLETLVVGMMDGVVGVGFGARKACSFRFLTPGIPGQGSRAPGFGMVS